MPLDHVTDFVTEGSGELVETVGTFDQPAVYINESARKGKRIYLFGVDDIEMPVEIRATGFFRDGLSESLDIAADRRIRDDGKLGIDFLRVLTAQRDLLVL